MQYIIFSIQQLFILILLGAILHLVGYIVSLFQLPFSITFPRVLPFRIINTSISILWIIVQLYLICASSVTLVLNSNLNKPVLVIIVLIFILYFIILAAPKRPSEAEAIIEENHSDILISSSGLFNIKVYAFCPVFFLLYFVPSLIWMEPVKIVAQICKFLLNVPVLNIIILIILLAFVIHMIFTFVCLIVAGIAYLTSGVAKK